MRSPSTSQPCRYGPEADLALDMWVKLARASAVFGARSGEQIRSFGLTVPQFSALETLGHKGPLTPGELCRKQLVTGGNVTVVLDNLEKEGLVRRVRSQEDRRSVVVHLTAKGRSLFRTIFVPHAEYIARLASALTQDEQRTLARLTRKLGRALQDRRHTAGGDRQKEKGRKAR